MVRREFYQVPPEAYLFRSVPKSEDKRNAPEESIRQWCCFELIRCYGIRVPEIEIERKIKSGSGHRRIDILVKKNDRPWLVVECKKPKHKATNDALDQAISYANSEGIKAEFVLFSDGTEWQVRRCIHGKWVSVVDLPPSLGFCLDFREVTHPPYQLSLDTLVSENFLSSVHQ